MKKILVFLFYSTLTFAQKDLSEAVKFQSELNESFSDSLKSPLMKEDLNKFEGLDFYSISEKYIVEANFIRTKKEKAFPMKTTTSRTPIYKKYGELHFEIDGKKFNLKEDFDKFFVRSNKTAGTRIRRVMQELKKFSQEVRTDVQEYKGKI